MRAVSSRGISDIVRHVSRFYGREIAPRRVEVVVRRVLGNKTQFDRKEALSVIKAINLRRLHLTNKMREELLFALRMNQRLPPNQRMSFAEIAGQVSPHVPISRSMLKKLNTAIRKDFAAGGKKPTKFVAKARRAPQNVAVRVKEILAKNYDIPLAGVVAALGISRKQLSAALVRERSLPFDSLRSEAIKQAVLNEVRNLGMDVTNEALAKRLHLSQTTIVKYRGVRGKGAGAKGIQKRTADDVLRWLGALTKPSQERASSVDLKTLVALTGASELTCRGAISKLKVRGLIREQGSNSFLITREGFGVLMKNGGNPRKFYERAGYFSTDYLERAKERLLAAILTEPQIGQRILFNLTGLIKAKRAMEAKQKLT